MSSILKGLQLNELSNDKLGDYKKAASADATAADKAGDYKRGDKRMSGIIKATKKEFANDKKKKDVAEAGMPFRGVGGAFSRGDDERHDLDPTEWYIVKDGKMYKTSVYPNQVQLAIAQGYSRSREEAKAKADRQGVAEGEVVPLGKKHRGDLGDIHSCPKCGGELQGGNYMGQRVKVCQPCKQVYLPPNSGIDQQGNKTNEQGVAEGSDNQEIGQQMANDGVTYSPAKENEIINLMAQYMQKAGMSSKQIRYLLSYNEDYVGDQLSFLPRQEVTEDQLDELKCWSGYHRVAGTKAGFPGSCAKNKTNEEDMAEAITLDRSKNPSYPNDPATVKHRLDNAKAILSDPKSDPDSRRAAAAIIAKSKQGVAEDEAPLKHHTARVSYHKEGDPHRRYEAIFKTTHNGGKEETEKRAKAAFAAKKKIVYDIVHEQGVAEEQHSCPHCGGEMVSEELMNEKKDACYYKVKSRYKVWPSAYASGALVKCRNKGASNWGNGGKKNESSILEGINRVDESLHDWFNKEKWVRFGPDGKIRGDCARGDDSEGKPKCLPQSKAQNLGKEGRASAASRKRREDPNPERSGKAINVNTKKKSDESIDEGWREKLGAAALAGSMALGAAGASADTRRVTPDGQGGFTGGMKPTATVTAPDNNPPTSDTSDPFKGLARAESADRQAQTITVGGKEYRMVEISSTDIRPRSGKQIVVPQAVLGERSIGNYMGILTGNTVFVISK